MKVRVLFNVPKLVIGFQKLPRSLRTLTQLCYQLRSQFHCADGIDFQCFPKVVEVFHFLGGKPPQISTATRFNANQTLGMKAVQRLTNRGFTDPELAGEKLFGEPGVFVKVFAQYVSLDAAV